MDIRKIVEQWLRVNGYDGLAGDGCGCQISELFCCEYPDMDGCQPGYKITCPGADMCPISEDCPAPGSGIWCMSATKQSKDVTNEQISNIALQKPQM